MIRTTLFLVFTIACILFSQNRESATSVKPRSQTEFSAENAMDYLNVIAAETHPIGSIANQKVRDYLVNELTALGLETYVESGHVRVSWGGNFNRSAYVENVIATLPGSDPNGKKVALAAHYDSVFEGPGAADDGYAVAAMIETVKLLKDEPRKNDIQLIITDGEEMGLLGAYYHVKKNEMDDVGVLLNYEARGNEGPCHAFEWSNNNAWLVREMKKSAVRPIANSLSYEIYNRMPNGSDFTAFLDKNVPGINNAFIDGFSYYHNPVDNVENISQKSIQHTGENMYLMTKHFANYDFSEEVETGNASFFNFYGMLIAYPAGWDLYFMILLGLVFIGMEVFARNKEGFKVIRIGKALLLMLLAIILAGAANFALGAAAKAMYPQYATFYSYHYYNHEWYFIGGIGLTIIILSFMSRWIIPSYGRIAQGHALFLIMALISIALYTTMRTGVFVMLFPAIVFGLCVIVKLYTEEEEREGLVLPLLYLFFLAGMWTLLSHSLFLAFSLDSLPGAILLSCLGGLSTMYLAPSIWRRSGRRVMLGFGSLLFIGSLIIAHLQSSPTEREPLLTNLKYVYDGEEDKSYVATFDDYIHDGHLGLLDNASANRLARHLPYSEFYNETDEDLSSYQSKITRDTSTEDHTILYHVVNPKRANIAYVFIPDITNVDSLFFDEEFNTKMSLKERDSYYTTLYGYGLDSLDIRMTTIDASKPVKVYVNMEYGELPIQANMPKGLILNDPNTVISHVLGGDD